METLNTDFHLLPVTGEPGFAAHLLLRLAQGSSRSLETVERGKAANPRSMPTAPPCGRGGSNVALGLDRYEPLPADLAYGDLLHRAQNLAALSVAQPAELGQKKATVGLIELDLLRVWIAEAFGATFLLEAGRDRLAKKWTCACTRSSTPGSAGLSRGKPGHQDFGSWLLGYMRSSLRARVTINRHQLL